MLFILEIVLTIVLCVRMHKAGKSWALGLLPVVIGFAGGFLFGIMLALGGATHVDTLSTIWIDFLVIGAQIWMLVVNKPKK